MIYTKWRLEVKKLISVLLMAMFMSFAFSEGLNGFWGVNFGESKDAVIKMMENRGWKESKSSNNEITFSMSNAKYAGLPAGDISFTFFNGKFSSAVVIISLSPVDKIEDVVEALIDKYSLSLQKKERIYTDGIPGEIKMYLSSNGNSFGYTVLTVGKNGIAQLSFLCTESILNETEVEKEKKREHMKDDL